MAGVGLRLNKFFNKKSMSSHIAGAGYSIVITIAPMLLVIVTLIIMQRLLGYTQESYYEKQLFQNTVLYIFLFSLLASAPLNAVLSRYISDVIFEETYADIMPCYYLGLLIQTLFCCLMGIPFCLHEWLSGGVRPAYVFISFCCFIALSFIFYTMMYLSICKDYIKISLFYAVGSIISLFLSLFLVYYIGISVCMSMLLALTAGFLITASLGLALLTQYFTEYSHQYKKILKHIAKYRKLILANTFYTLGLFVHNFVFWTSDLQIRTAGSFVCAETYDYASCVAMFTNISASIIFIVLVEMKFNARYKQYSEAIIGGRLLDIQKTGIRMFRLLADELMSLVRIQFIISTVLFLVSLIVLQRFGYTGTIIQVYPCLAAGYFILFLMYPVFLFLYYFNDLNGALYTGCIFCLMTLAASICLLNTSPVWYGGGLTIGAFAGWTFSYFRLCRLEKHMKNHIFCNGTILKQVSGTRPSGQVYPDTQK